MPHFIKSSFSFLLLFALSLAVTSAVMPVAMAKEIKLRAELAQDYVYGKKGSKSYLRLDLEGLRPPGDTERTPVNIAIVIDQSGSMNGAKIAQAKAAAKLAINRLNRDDIISIVAYSDRVNVLVPATRLDDRARLREKIDLIRATGRTALYAGTTQGVRELEKFLDENKVNRVILLSDGLANIGPSRPSDLEALGRKAASKGISITTIGLGLGYNEDLMTKLAFASDGNHAFVRRPDDLVSIFDKEFGDVLSVIALDIEIIIELRLGLRPIRVMGRHADIDGQRVRLKLNQLYGAQEKHVIVEVETMQQFTEGANNYADIDVTYRTREKSGRQSMALNKRADFSLQLDKVKSSTNQRVMAGVVKQIANERNEFALQLRDKGKIKEAQKVLRQNSTYLREQAGRVGQYGGGLNSLAAENSKDAESLDSKNWAASRKAMKARQHKLKTQQAY